MFHVVSQLIYLPYLVIISRQNIACVAPNFERLPLPHAIGQSNVYYPISCSVFELIACSGRQLSLRDLTGFGGMEVQNFK